MINKFSLAVRIRTQAQYRHVFAVQQRLFGRFFVLFYRKNQLHHPRIGIIIRKRNIRHAVDRNKIKRKVREIFRVQQKDLPAMDIVIVVKSEAERASKQELQVCLEKLMTQLVRYS